MMHNRSSGQGRKRFTVFLNNITTRFNLCKVEMCTPPIYIIIIIINVIVGVCCVQREQLKNVFNLYTTILKAFSTSAVAAPEYGIQVILSSEEVISNNHEVDHWKTTTFIFWSARCSVVSQIYNEDQS